VAWRRHLHTSSRISTGISGSIDNLAFLWGSPCCSPLAVFLAVLARFVPRVSSSSGVGTLYSSLLSVGCELSSAAIRIFSARRVETIRADDGGSRFEG